MPQLLSLSPSLFLDAAASSSSYPTLVVGSEEKKNFGPYDMTEALQTPRTPNIRNRNSPCFSLSLSHTHTHTHTLSLSHSLLKNPLSQAGSQDELLVFWCVSTAAAEAAATPTPTPTPTLAAASPAASQNKMVAKSRM